MERRHQEIAALSQKIRTPGRKGAELLDAAAALADIYQIRTRRA